MADIQTLVNNIPDAQDGNVITSDYHNTIKAALEAIAGQLGGGGGGGKTVTVTVPANFFPVFGATNAPWDVKIGFAEDSGPGHTTEGWIPLSLPDGVILTSLGVIVLKVNASPAGSVNLLSVPIDGSDNNSVLATINLNGITLNNTLPLTQKVNVPSAKSGLLTVNNSQFKYVVEANISFSTAPASVTIYAMQVTYTTP